MKSFRRSSSVIVAIALAVATATTARAQCDAPGFGETWGPGIGPPPAECGGNDGGSSLRGAPMPGMGGGGGGGGGGGRGNVDYTAPGAKAAPLRGTVATVDNPIDSDKTLIYGPFEAGFSAQQTAQFFGCTGDVSIAGGLDTLLAEEIVEYLCDKTREQVSVLDDCGGHARPYHYHEKMTCLYSGDTATGGHSTRIGTALDGHGIYGKYVATNALPTDLDACGGRTGVTPDSNGEEVYYYMVQDVAPFTVGCFGPVASVDECRALYDTCGDGDETLVTTRDGTRRYDPDCPCYDAAGSNVGGGNGDNGDNGGGGGNGGSGTVTTTAAPAPAPTTPTPTTERPARGDQQPTGERPKNGDSSGERPARAEGDQNSQNGGGSSSRGGQSGNTGSRPSGGRGNKGNNKGNQQGSSTGRGGQQGEDGRGGKGDDEEEQGGGRGSSGLAAGVGAGAGAIALCAISVFFVRRRRTPTPTSPKSPPPAPVAVAQPAERV